MKRRRFLAGCTAGLAGYLGMASVRGSAWRKLPRSKDGVETLGTARNLIFVLLRGGPSHIDTFDLKEGGWTPDNMGVETLKLGMKWPSGYMSKLAQMPDKFTLLRSINALEAVHSRAVYHLLTAHRQNAAVAAEIPHFASMVSFKLKDQRRPTDSLPTAMMIGRNPAKNGFLPIEHLGLALSDNASIPNLQHGFEGEGDRFDLLSSVLEAGVAPKDGRNDHLIFQDQARDMMRDVDLATLLEPEVDGNGLTPRQVFRRQCEAAARVIAADKGVRVFQLELGGWDHHFDIYQGGDYGHPGLSRAFDDGFSYLIEDLSARPGAHGGASLLDETLLVAIGEFGRTIGTLNTSRGRDHFPAVLPAILAGGGIKGGRVIGSSDSTGSRITDPGWSRNRYMGINDLMATLYSALGIDWTEIFEDTPSGRIFEIVDTIALGPAYAIQEMFE